MPFDLKSTLPIILILLAVCLVLTLLMRMFRAFLVMLLLMLVLPVIATIMLGNGQGYVSTFASFFAPSVQQQIIDGYDFYHEQYQQNPVLDFDRLQEYSQDAVSAIQGLWKKELPSDDSLIFNDPSPG